MQQGNAGQHLYFYFDHLWYVPLLAVFFAFIASSFIHRKELPCKNGMIQRHDIYARVGHWLNAIGILLLLYSGYQLGFWFVERKVYFTSGAQQMFNLHFIGAVTFLLGASLWLGNMFLDPKRLEEHAPYKGSLKDAIWHYLHLAGVVKSEGAPTGKYEASERLAFVPLTLLAIIIALTGLVKVLAHAVNLPGWLMHAVHLTHDLSSVVLAFLLVFHILLAAVVPWAWPMLISMITGNVPVKEVKKNHKKWYKELQDKGLCPREDA